MAWKLKKWKGAEAEEEHPEDGVFDISGAIPEQQYVPTQPPAHTEPEPSQAFNASAFADQKAVKPGSGDTQDAEPGPSVIAMGPVESEPIVAPPAFHPESEAPGAAAHSLDTHEPTLTQPADFAPGAPEQELGPPDYYAESVAHADEVVAAFQQAASVHSESGEEPIAFEIEPPGQAVANLHERAVASAPADADTLGAFAPYQPAPAAPGPGFAIDEPPAPAVIPTPAAHARNFEEDLSFAPPFSSHLIVKIGPFSATYEIDKPEYTIGRPDPKTGNSPDIALEWDDAVSRRHARILRRTDGDYLEDVGSSNGTMLNGQLIAVNTPILLKNEDVITLGERTQISYVR